MPSASGWAAWPPILVVWGPGGASAMHAHHAMHVMLAREGTITVTTSAKPRRVAGVITAPDAPHAIDARGRMIVLVFVDPESDVGAKLREGGVRFIDGGLRDALLGDLVNDD